MERKIKVDDFYASELQEKSSQRLIEKYERLFKKIEDDASTGLTFVYLTSTDPLFKVVCDSQHLIKPELELLLNYLGYHFRYDKPNHNENMYNAIRITWFF